MSALPVEEIRELVQFLSHANADVRTQTLAILPSLVANEASLAELTKQGFYKPLLRCVRETNAKNSDLALRLVVNLTAEEETRLQLVDAGAADTCMEYLQVNLSKSPRLPLLVLNNITSSPAGAIALMQEGKAYEGLHVTRLIKWLCDPSRFIPGVDSTGVEKDDIGIAANVLTNLSQLPSFRYVSHGHRLPIASIVQL